MPLPVLRQALPNEMFVDFNRINNKIFISNYDREVSSFAYV